MAEFAAKRWIDLVVADQAIRHLWKGGMGDGIRLFEAAMAGRTRVCRIQMAAYAAGRREVLFGIDGGGNYRRDVP